jgi:GntR family transcriptional regulator/MocR family aminotransferase
VGQTASVDQVILTEFIDDGHFARHVRRMRLVYAERQAVMLAAADAHFSRWLEVHPSPAGMHLVGWLRDDMSAQGVSDRALADVALASGVVTTPLSSYRLPVPGGPAQDSMRPRGALLLGYAGYSEPAIRDAARRLEQAFAGAVSPRPSEPRRSPTQANVRGN